MCLPLGLEGNFPGEYARKEPYRQVALPTGQTHATGRTSGLTDRSNTCRRAHTDRSLHARLVPARSPNISFIYSSWPYRQEENTQQIAHLASPTGKNPCNRSHTWPQRQTVKNPPCKLQHTSPTGQKHATNHTPGLTGRSTTCNRSHTWPCRTISTPTKYATLPTRHTLGPVTPGLAGRRP